MRERRRSSESLQHSSTCEHSILTEGGSPNDGSGGGKDDSKFHAADRSPHVFLMCAEVARIFTCSAGVMAAVRALAAANAPVATKKGAPVTSDVILAAQEQEQEHEHAEYKQCRSFTARHLSAPCTVRPARANGMMFTTMQSPMR